MITCTSSLSKTGLDHSNLSLQFYFDPLHNNFQHYFTCMADQRNSSVVGAIGVRANIHWGGGGRPSFARMDSVGGGG